MTGLDKYIDIDAVLAERKDRATPLKVKLFKEEWDLPGTAPAALMLRLSRWQQKGWVAENGDVIDDIAPFEQFALLSDIVPGETLDQWCAKGLDLADLTPVIDVITAAYQRQIDARDAVGEAPAPGRGSASPKSSNGGRTSKRTSRGSTKSATSGKR